MYWIKEEERVEVRTKGRNCEVETVDVSSKTSTVSNQNVDVSTQLRRFVKRQSGQKFCKGKTSTVLPKRRRISQTVDVLHQNVDGFLRQRGSVFPGRENVDGFIKTSTVCLKRRRFPCKRRRLWQLGVYKLIHTTPKIILELVRVALSLRREKWRC